MVDVVKSMEMNCVYQVCVYQLDVVSLVGVV